MAIDLNSPGAFGNDESFDKRLGDLVGRLAKARRRVTVNALLAGAILALVIALGVFCVLQLLSGLFGERWPVAFQFGVSETLDRGVGQHLVVALVVAVAAFLFAVGTTIAGRPWLSSMAQAADSRFKLNEVMSTALEVAAERRTGVIPEALVLSAQARAGMVDSERLIPIRPPRAAFAIPVLLILSVYLAISPPPPVFERLFGGDAAAAVIPTAELEARTQTAADLHAIAAIVRQDGEERANPEMQAIARQLEDLATQMDGTALDREAAGAAMERLNGLLRTAYEQAGEAEGAPRDHSRLLQNAFDQFAPERAEALREATGPRPEPANPEAAGADVPFEAVALRGGETEGGGPTAPAPGMGVRADDITRTEQAGNRAEIVSEAPPVNDIDDVYGPDGPDGGGAMPPGGQFAGQAAGAEAGDIAGAGAAGLFGNAAAMNALEAAGEMMLADRNPGDGRRITLDLPPLTALLGLTADGTPAPGAWQAQAEGQVTRTPVPAGDREAIRRYFDALMAERAE